ncbi:ATP-binding protein [Pseudotabrizicola sp. 4114]|uniref:ATP-binding protein n=1 Tax=Pseudotabrizicola sp. 4114 TaxID=2817731 RepID=UPI00285815DF|nr:signal transduction histidine kinase [Pseudorhodobacter sp. 4114]
MRGQSNPSEELARLFEVEYGNRREVAVRLLGVIGGSGLLYGYTGWNSSWVWAASFLVAHATYHFFLKARMPRATPRDEVISGLLFLLLLASFLWMPALMICENDRALSICGAALVGCILVFLVRRSDSAPIMVYGEIAVVGTMIAVVFLKLIPQFTDPFAKLGLIASGSALLYYFVEAAQVSRRLRIKAAEANLRSRQAEKMAAIGRLAGGVAHDFNNNLTAILGHLELLALVEDPEERHASIAEASVAARQAAKTVKQLLAFARKERLSLALQDSDEILEGLVSLTRRLIPTSVSIKIERGLEKQNFMADRAQLLSSLINLVINAVDAMPNGGDITLSSLVVRLTKAQVIADGSSLGVGKYVKITVQDQGSGIPTHILPQVLEPFFTTKAVGKGTGLGLSMAFGVSRELGGGLTIVTSEMGTSVSIFLPAT